MQAQLDDTYISAVLTAHPTEVQRQTILSLRRQIRALLEQYHTAIGYQRHRIEQQLEATLLSQWQTNETRHFKITVKDEIDNGIAYFDLSFLKPLPNLYRKLDYQLKERFPTLTCQTYLISVVGLVATVTAIRLCQPIPFAMRSNAKRRRCFTFIVTNWASYTRVAAVYPPCQSE